MFCILRSIQTDASVNASHTCSVIGGGHFRTFDGLEYNFPGKCVYTMVSECMNDFFAIELITNYKCDGNNKNCQHAVYIR